MIRVVTDSTAYLPQGWAAQWGIDVVPVQVVIDDVSYDETDADQAAAVTAALLAMRPVTTSRPTPERFTRAVDAAAQAGATGVVIVTLSARLSATHESALMAARDAAVPTRVIDSQTIAMGLGFAAVAGAAAALAGSDLDEVAEAIRSACAATEVTFVVDSLEYLRRGGRIGAARAAVGQALQVKPILAVRDGSVVEVHRVRTLSRAMDYLREQAERRLADRVDAGSTAFGASIAVQYSGHADRAEQLASALRAALPTVQIVVCPVGGVVGAHVGPGMIATVISAGAD